MKKLSINLLKSLFVILFITTSTISLLPTAGAKTVSEFQANVNEPQVVDYLEEYSYEVIYCEPKSNSINDWVAVVIVDGQHYFVTIHIIGNNIVGHEVLPF